MISTSTLTPTLATTLTPTTIIDITTRETRKESSSTQNLTSSSVTIIRTETTPTTTTPTMTSSLTSVHRSVWDLTTVHSIETSTQFKCRSAKYYRDPTDPECRRFCRCIYFGNSGYEIKCDRCPNGTVFDDPIQACQHPEEVIEPCPQIL